MPSLKNTALIFLELFSIECCAVLVEPPMTSSLLLQIREYLLTYNLRDSDCSRASPQPRTNYCKRSLAYSGGVLWNSLPLDIRQSPSHDEFKSKLMNYHFDS